jgi:hypothetical protein
VQRHGGERGKALQREVPQLPVIEFGRAGKARRAPVGNGDLRIANPGEQALHEPVLLAQGVQRQHRAPAQQAKVAGVLGNVHAAERLDQTVEQVGRGALDPRFAVARAALGIHHVVPGTPQLHHARYQLGRVLQVGVDDDHGIARSQVEPGRHGGFLAEIAAQVDERNARIASAQRPDQRQRPVAAAIVDVDDFRAHVDQLEHQAQALVESFQHGFFVVRRHDHGQQLTRHPGSSKSMRGADMVACQLALRLCQNKSGDLE